MKDPSSHRPDDLAVADGGLDGRPQLFADPAMDRFAAALLNLTAEFWVQEERILALEAEARPSAPAPDLEGRLQALIQRVFAPLREGPNGPLS